MAEDTVSRRREHARVPRDHLPKPVHPGAGRAETRADGASAEQAAHAPLAPCNGQRTVPRPDRRRCLDPRKACGSGRSSGSRALGRRSAERGKEQLHRDFSRASFALCHAGQSAGQRHRSFVRALSRHVRKLPASLRRSLTWDRGLEMARHKEFTVATKVKVYFCDPQSPWQRGTNENTNLLLRQYFPRGTDLAPISQAQLDQVALRLNRRPRKTLGFQTPASRLQASVASTV